MDLKKTGALIAQRRKELGLTQKDLADRLQVTDKAISRWETGKGFPDTASLQPLAQVLEISIAEIINGELTRPDDAAQQTDDALLSAMRYGKRMANPVTGTLLLVCGALFALSPMVIVGVSPILLWGISAITFIWGILQFWNKWPGPGVSRWISTALILCALVLQMIPGSAVLIFAGPDYRNVEYYSCFDLMIVGYGIFMPFLSGILTAFTLGMALVRCVGKERKLENPVFVCTIVSAVLMALPVLLSSELITFMGFLIILFLALSAVFQARANGVELK